MHAKLTPIALVLTMVLAPAAAGQPQLAEDIEDEPAGVELGAALSGASEVNAQGERDQGSAHGTGLFSAWLIPEKPELCYTLSWEGILPPTAAHIHFGKTGENGDVFVGLPNLDVGEHCIAIDRVKAAALAATPDSYYVNVHNSEFPAGAVRGQLTTPVEE